MKTLPIATGVAIDAHEVVARAVEAGIARGARLARGKKPAAAQDALYRAVMDELTQVLALGDGRARK